MSLALHPRLLGHFDFSLLPPTMIQKRKTGVSWALRLLLVVGFGIDLSTAFPSAAGTCPGGMPAVEGAQIEVNPGKKLVNGSLADAFYSIDIDRSVTLTPSSDVDNPSIVLLTGKDYLVRIAAGLKRYKGFLIRLEAPDTVDTTTALIPASEAQIATVCTDPVVGLCHADSELKNFARGTLRINEPSVVFLDVTVVGENNNVSSAFFYSRYTVKFMEEVAAAAPTPPTQFPSISPVATASAPDDCDAIMAAAEECVATELTTTELAECNKCIESSYLEKQDGTSKPSFEDCSDLADWTCYSINNCNEQCSSCIDELELVLFCSVLSPLGCTLMECDITSKERPENPPSSPSLSLTQPTLPPATCSIPAPPPLPGKRGIAFPLRDEGEEGSWKENLPKVKALEPYWYYSWGPTIPEEARIDGAEFVPMIWGGVWDGVATAEEEYAAQIKEITSDDRYVRLFGFNEPDREEQADMSVSEALKLWPVLEAAKLSLVSPGCATPMGGWMREFMAQVDDKCDQIDYVSFHWYGSANPLAFQNEVESFHRLYKKPVMVTEFAVADWDAGSVKQNRFTKKEVLSFMKEVLPWMEAQDWIVAYTWFPFPKSSPEGSPSALFNSKDQLTKLGKYYRSVTNENPKGDTSIDYD